MIPYIEATDKQDRDQDRRKESEAAQAWHHAMMHFARIMLVEELTTIRDQQNLWNE
jgi:hypothetical protein